MNRGVLDATGAGPVRRHVYGVLELTRVVKETLEDCLGQVWVEGEVSNLRQPASGHMYFTLKDAQAQLAAVFFKGSQQGSPVEIKDGQQLRAFGEITVYEAQGKYQLIISRVEDAGQGALLERFLKLKKQLHDEGLFDPDRKQPLPSLPRHIGLVTSKTGAAVRDILQVLNRRHPNLHVVLAPVQVQGDRAAGMIVKAIEHLNRRDDLELLIVGRGGGSLEDLWPFNEEAVARAVAASRLPVISAVGHETDTTICDLAADVRAPTPSAAAEIAVPEKRELENRLQHQRGALGRALRTCELTLRNRLTRCARSYVFREPQHLLGRYRERLDNLAQARTRHLEVVFRERQQTVDDLHLRLTRWGETATPSRRQDLRRLQAQLDALNPSAVLSRGYSLTRLEDGTVVRRARNLETDQRLFTRLAEGIVASRVEAPNEEEQDADERER